ncbi:hypothetical protein VOLCADRAFT_100517 [Volvox carteri f. nagariensis]|uniref:Uncharacterized protein n=1 Tax=Volvox carteri f. nagariensis TaxID=3068 RepID=D8UKD5_VOLCA|nr:uncharacterized protein VOLCADRAFT_100517 [Volvox carteri f. nagariensis]EFJ39821.1 hypothetical protein VOLCADRAFT_100517 [Volvox carteri f. nagariensis]|eukprot:XP_002959122.1 hypothetical protein VOLCADRAFT_100517 [Volvox carteri f. nagariensis]
MAEAKAAEKGLGPAAATAATAAANPASPTTPDPNATAEEADPSTLALADDEDDSYFEGMLTQVEALQKEHEQRSPEELEVLCKAAAVAGVETNPLLQIGDDEEEPATTGAVRGRGRGGGRRGGGRRGGRGRGRGGGRGSGKRSATMMEEEAMVEEVEDAEVPSESSDEGSESSDEEGQEEAVVQLTEARAASKRQIVRPARYR